MSEQNLLTTSLDKCTSLQREILRFYIETLGSPVTGVELYQAGWWGEIGGKAYSRREFTIVRIVLDVGKGDVLHFYGSLGDAASELAPPTSHDHQFIFTADEEHVDFVHLVAYARVHQLLAAPLNADDTFLLDETHPLRIRGYTNVLVPRADLHAPFRGKNDIRMGATSMRFLSLVPLEPREWHVKIEGGIAALFEDFERRGRDLLHVRPRPESA